MIAKLQAAIRGKLTRMALAEEALARQQAIDALAMAVTHEAVEVALLFVLVQRLALQGLAQPPQDIDRRRAGPQVLGWAWKVTTLRGLDRLDPFLTGCVMALARHGRGDPKSTSHAHPRGDPKRTSLPRTPPCLTALNPK